MFFVLLGILTEQQKHFVEQIFREHHTQFQRISMRIVHSEASAEDAVSTAYLKIMEHIERISEMPCPQMTAFCVTIVKHTSIDMIRKSKRFTYMDEWDHLRDESEVGFEDEYIHKSDSLRLSQLIDKLPQEDRFLIHMRYVQEMKYAEIGALLGITEDTAKKRGQRIVQKLKKLYGKEGLL